MSQMSWTCDKPSRMRLNHGRLDHSHGVVAPMRLMFASTEFPNECDPTKATFNLDLMRSLNDKHDVEVISPISWVDELRFRRRCWSSDITRQRSVDGMQISHPRYYYPPRLMRQHYDRFLWWSLRDVIQSRLAAPPPDCILSYWAHPDGSVAVRLAKQLNVPSIVMVGGSDVLVATRYSRRKERIRDALIEADAVLTVSDDLAENIRALDVPAKSIHVIRRGVDEWKFYPGDPAEARGRLGLPTGHPAILWVGRMVPVKGVTTLIKAFHQVSEVNDEAHLYLVGDGEERRTMESMVSALRLQDRVHFAGACSHDKMGDWFRAADVTVLPSLSEGIPNVLLESLASGTPFVASRVGGIPEIAGHEAARLVSPGSETELASAILTVLRNPPSVPPEARPCSLQGFADSVASLADRVTRQYRTATVSRTVSEHRRHFALTR